MVQLPYLYYCTGWPTTNAESLALSVYTLYNAASHFIDHAIGYQENAQHILDLPLAYIMC